MAQRTSPLLPATDALLRAFGERLRLARQRRRLTAKQVAERAGMAPMTLRGVERGEAGVTIGAYLAVLQVLGMESDFDLLAKADPLGRELQDARLPGRPRAARPLAPRREAWGTLLPAPKHLVSEAAPGWIQGSGFASAETLAGLIEVLSPPEKPEA